MRIQVRYYAALRDILGVTSEVFHLDQGATIAHLRAAAVARHPAVARLRERSLPFVRNPKFAGATDLLAEGDVVDVMPTVHEG